MKFYELVRSDTEHNADRLELSEYGEWVTRADAEQVERERDALLKERQVWRTENTLFRHRMNTAEERLEQAAKDAVEMAKQVQNIVIEGTSMWKKAQAIIEKYEGGKPCE